MRLSVTVAHLRARLSEYLAHVKAGNEVVVTERGLPVARLAAMGPGERPSSHREQSISTGDTESLFAESSGPGASRRDLLARSGSLKPGRGRPRAALLTPPSGEPLGDAILATLLADRGGGR